MFVLSIIWLLIAAAAFIAGRVIASIRMKSSIAASLLVVLSLICFGLSMFTQIGASRAGVVTIFGKVLPDTLSAGAHFVLPWAVVTEVNLSQQQATADKSDAGSKDLQSVHADLAVNFTVDASKARELYIINPALDYKELMVRPAIYEVFKAAVAKYTAEELVTKRAEVSDLILATLSQRLAPDYIHIQSVNLLNFGFSNAFNAAIEEKVTASQKAETAKRNLERVKYEADARVEQSEGEAKAIAIQAAAVDKQGGAGYVQLQAITKWDGKLPEYVTSGSAMPFINVK